MERDVIIFKDKFSDETFPCSLSVPLSHTFNKSNIKIAESTESIIIFLQQKKK